MEISWLGHGCFRLRGRDATVLTDPVMPATGYKIGKLTADIITLSSAKPEINNLQAVGGTPKVLTSPGEYEIAGVLISALRTHHGGRGDAADRNIAYVIDIDDVRICHLGEISQVPSSDDVEALGAADILLLPVGGASYLGAAAAAETVSLLEPKIVIPMIYQTDAATLTDLEPVERFLKEMSVEPKPPEARLSVTKSNVPDHTTVVLLNYRG